MLTIYKYKLEGYENWISAPVVKWLSAAYQEKADSFVAWAVIDLDAPDRLFKIVIAETGMPFPEASLNGLTFLGSVNLNYYIAHIFVGEYNPETKELIKEEREAFDFNNFITNEDLYYTFSFPDIEENNFNKVM